MSDAVQVGESLPSNTIYTVPFGGGGKTPSPPRNFSALPLDDYVCLSWQEPAECGDYPLLGYMVYRRSDMAQTERVFRFGPNDTAFRDTSVWNGKRYWYHVTALNLIGESWPSDEICVVPDDGLMDTVFPVIIIDSPLDGTTFSHRDVRVNGTSSDNDEVRLVEVCVDGRNWVVANGTSRWDFNITLAAGANCVLARATDAGGNVNFTTITIFFNKKGSSAEAGPPLNYYAGGAALSLILLCLILKRPWKNRPVGTQDGKDIRTHQ